MDAGWPNEERRTEEAPDLGVRRRASDITPPPRSPDLAETIRQHEIEAREWRARHDERLKMVEERADLLDGRAGNDDGILGTLGELRGEVRSITARMDRQVKAQQKFRDEVRKELEAIKTTTVHIDGNTTPPESRGERVKQIGVTIVLPVLIASLPVIGTIVAAILALKGQLAAQP